LTLLVAAIVVRSIRALARWLLTFGGASGKLSDPAADASDLAADQQTQSFWLKRISLIAGLFFFGWAIASFMPQLSFSTDMVRLAVLTFGACLLAVGIEIAWRRPASAASLLTKSLLTLYLCVLWLAWVAGLLGLLWTGLYALLLPGLVRGVGNVAQKFAGRAQRGGMAGVILNVL